MDSVYKPEIDDDAAKALYTFTKQFNDASEDNSIRVVGYLHGRRGAKMRIEPVEKCSTRNLRKWKRMAATSQCKILNVQVSASEACVDICIEYKPSTSLLKNIQWQRYLLPAILLVFLLKYSGLLAMFTGYQI
jgi:hypothetical protein